MSFVLKCLFCGFVSALVGLATLIIGALSVLCYYMSAVNTCGVFVTILWIGAGFGLLFSFIWMLFFIGAFIRQSINIIYETFE